MTLHRLYIVLFGLFFLFYAINALSDAQEEHYVVGGILKALLAAQFC